MRVRITSMFLVFAASACVVGGGDSPAGAGSTPGSSSPGSSSPGSSNPGSSTPGVGEEAAPAPGSPLEPVAGGGGSDGSPVAEPAPSGGDDPRDLGLPPPRDGFTRYYPPAEPVPVAESRDFIQWIDGPLDQDYDIVAVSGKQGIGGHHAVVYSFPEAQEIGFSREFTVEDQVSTALLGAASVDGGVGIELPEGVVFRARQGSYVVVQAHYINTTEEPIMGRAVVDVEMVPADPSHQVAAIFANTGAVELPAGQRTTLDKYCTVFEDVTILRLNNHMHDHGVSVSTEVSDFFGTTRMLKDDPAWNYEWSLNPNYSVFSLEAPEVIRAGETVHTRCTYENDTTAPISFPNEMCAFTSFILREQGDLICFDGLVLSGLGAFL